jgi:hypothetical protein
VALSFDTVEWTPEMDKLHVDPEHLAAFADDAAAFKGTIGLVDESGEPAPKVRNLHLS